MAAPPDSLFGILMRQPWWVTLLVAAVLFGVAYAVFPPVAPFIAGQSPLAFANVTNVLRSMLVQFSERVQNVDASDLLINGIAATNVTGSGSNYVFSFPQPPFGEVEVTWAPGHGITDFGWPTVLPIRSRQATSTAA